MIVVALADFEAGDQEQLALVEGATYVRITEDYGNGWSFGYTIDGTQEGIFPQTYCEAKTI
jgi:hypothetical protein